MMKRLTFFQFLPEKFKKWRQQHQTRRYIMLAKAASGNRQQEQTVTTRLPHWHKLPLRESRQIQPERASAVFVIAVVSLTGVLGYRFYDQPKLHEDAVAPQTIKAPYTLKIEDTRATEEKRRAARQISMPVMMFDPAVNWQIDEELQQALAQGDNLRALAGSVPYASTAVLSTATQSYLRSCPDAEWQLVLKATNTASATTVQAAIPSSVAAKAIAELQAYRQQVAPEKFSELVASVNQARYRYDQGITRLSELQRARLGTLYESALLSLSDADWEKTKSGIRTSAKRILAQGISPGLPPRIWQEAVNLHVQSHVPDATEALATELLLKVLKPNLKQDVEQIRRQAEQAALAVQPVTVEVKKGEVIVSAGDRISHTEFLLLDRFGLSRREINWLGLLQQAGLVIGAIAVYRLVEWRFNPKLRAKDRLLVLLLSCSPLLLATFKVPFTSLPAIGLLLGSFYGFPLSATVIGLLTALPPLGLGVNWLPLLTGAAGGMLGSLLAARMRSREELALLGGGVGVTQGSVYLLLQVVVSATTGSLGNLAIWEAGLFAVSGWAWSVVALGLSPYLEHLFDIVTPIRLVELANPNRPLLKRLATEAPGTFQHTLFVATLAEAAAKALGCNVELVRAGTLYHDIGKLHDPLAFIENQIGCGNKHDEINDPWKSAEIIKKHVSEGLVMARKHRLPTAIQQFIPEHQGKMLIAYFYHQAQQLAQQDPNIEVQEADFRYDGPIPQSRETAIVNLADSCEAALRSLKDATPESALVMINKILRARWQDNQLGDSGLKREEMSQIAEIFVEVWQQFHHKRIAYPKSVIINNS